MITLHPTIGDVQRGLREREFFLFYQPKIAFATGRVVGAEALLRWIPPGKKPIRPATFLPVAEQNGLGQEILPAMLPQLLADIRQMRAIAPNLRISFNVTAEDLQTRYLADELEAALSRHLIEKANLDIEITETVLMDGNPSIARTVDDLVQLGIELVMDDFGTGYSSLDVLSRYPFSGLKIDQGVIGRMSLAPRNAHIVRSGLLLARELGLRTVAEGIENKATYIYLSALGCREGQGKWICDPLSRSKFEDLLRSGRSWPASELGMLNDVWLAHDAFRRRILDSVHALALTPSEERRNLPHIDSFSVIDWEEALGYSRDVGKVEDIRIKHDRMVEAAAELIACAQDPNQRQHLTKRIGAFLELACAIDRMLSAMVHARLETTLNA